MIQADGIPVEDRLRAAFDAKAPHRALLESIPLYLITHENPALDGLADFARAPERFAPRLEGRMWRAT